MRKLRNLLVLGLIACLLLAGCGGEDPAPVYTYPTEETKPNTDQGSLTILFTGGVENIFASHDTQGAIGYAALAAYRDRLEADDRQVVLVDGGNAMSDGGAGGVKAGKTLAELIGSVGYDVRVPGRWELSYGISDFCKLTEKMTDCVYTSCNLLDETGMPAFESYVMVKCGDVKVGFVGITGPYGAEGVEEGSFGSGDKDDYYASIQDAIDEARYSGADYVIAVGNLGTDPRNTPWTSAEVIANTTGLSAFLDCGSGAVLEGSMVKDLDQYEVPLCAPGSGFAYVGEITLDLNDGSVEVELLTKLGKEDKTIAQTAANLEKELE